MREKALLSTILIVSLSGCESWPKIHQCPDGSPVTIYKDPYAAYAPVAETFDANVANLNLKLDQFKSTVGVEGLKLEKKVVALQELLNQENINHQNNLKAVVMAHNTRPCDKLITDELFKFVNLSKQRSEDLLNAQAQIVAAEQSGKIESVVDALVEKLPDCEGNCPEKKTNP